MALLIKISYVLCATLLGAISIAYISSLIIPHDQGWDALANFLFFLIVGGITGAISSIISLRYINRAQLGKLALITFILLVVVLFYASIIAD